MVTPHAAGVNPNCLNDFIIPDDDKIIVSVHAYIPYNLAMNKQSPVKDFTENDKNEITNLMKSLNERYISKGIPVIMGEFGTIDKQNEDSRAEHVQYYIKTAKEYEIPCVWWDDGGDFILYDRKEMKFKFPKILDGIMNGAN